MSAASTLADLTAAIASGDIRVVDLSGTIGPDTPLLKLPPEVGANTPKIEKHYISNFDENGQFFTWSWLKIGEHSGTHFDAPAHWITGRDYEDGATDSIPVANFVAPACVIDCSRESDADADYLLTADGVKAWEAEHGAIPAGCWVLMRSDWYKRAHNEDLFLNTDETGPHSPGPTVDCIQYLVAKDVIGWGVETVGTDAGLAGGMEPSFPAHTLMHGANKYGLASLANLDQLPPKGAVIITPPLKIIAGSGSPLRELALVEA